MLQNDRTPVLCDVAAAIWNAMQSEEVPVSGQHRVSLHRVTILSDQLWLQHVSLSYVYVVCTRALSD